MVQYKSRLYLEWISHAGSKAGNNIPIHAIIVKGGRVLPQEIALKLAHLKYIFLGVPAKYLYKIRKITNPITWEMTEDAIVRPWMIK